MKKSTAFFGIAILLISSVTASAVGFKENFEMKGDGFIQSEFENLIDHFDPTDERTYSQRFWYNADGFDYEKGPIFLYICGEYVCGVNEERQFPVKVAQEFNGLFVYLEHRYYGESQPFPDSNDVADLGYLTAKHALADLAVFLSTLNNELIKTHGGEKRKIVVVGGSYPGALSAWFRAKYPHIAEASWASSAVVQAVEDMTMFDYQIYNSTMRSSETCTKVIQDFTEYYDSLVESGDESTLNDIKSYFDATDLDNALFARTLVHFYVGKVQYGKRTQLCEFLENIADLPILERFKKVADNYDENDYKYLDEVLRTENNGHISTGDAWHYQYCTEYGYFQTPYDGVSMRSKLLKLPYWQQGCRESFGDQIITEARETNVFFGSDMIRGSNTFYTNGGEDPWQWVGVTHVYDELNQVSRLLQCENCAHCVELYNEREDDSDELKQVRLEIKEWLKKIIYS
ncbi:unnamed protein product [Moneuplotes crassus]|uniref:Serine carboxypeptidase n=1 Tax=Euplotes crassus TaxID=5936 RepID=A0AAD1UP55_EUPCR|nr:unnamed protein product [Moneuplotes crassus]